MVNPLISVIIPVFNVEQYVDRCIRSVVNQSYNNLEIIIIDDGSKDNSLALCKKWEKDDCRIKVYCKENSGSSSARNYGLDVAQGEYVTFVDSDDYLDVDMYQDMMEEVIDSGVDIVCCGRFITWENKVKKLFTMPEKREFDSKEALAQMLTYGHLDEAVWDKIYKKELFSKIRFPEGEINEDLVVMPGILNGARKIVHVGKAHYYYWQTANGITKSNYSERNSVVPRHMVQIVDFIKANYPELQKESSCFLARYGFDMLSNLVMTPKAKKDYYDDYSFYMKSLKNNYLCLIRFKTFSLKYKIKALMMILHIYVPIMKAWENWGVYR